MTHLKVAVRVRPLSEREKQENSISVVSVENGNTISITNIKVPEQNTGDSRERVRKFTFDYCFDENSTQEQIFEAVEDVVEKAIQKRYHSCVLAYGQSSSGKTHTMMGLADDTGLTPRLCQNIFDYFQSSASEDEIKNTYTTVSYLEIYNEKVRDLLVAKDGLSELSGYSTLKVREHPRKGPYVQGLSEHTVHNSQQLLDWLQKGNSHRKVAATLNNPQSSRSHSVFTITSCGSTKLHLVDLAGSERAASRCSGTPRFREGANINKSLVALGNVIFVLAEKSSKSRSGRSRFVPYRDSLLTWLLKDTLGGNSKTIMIATVSPSNTCYSETINTLRFGQGAKQIITQPFINEDPKEKTIRELRAEILRLKELLYLNQKVTPVPPVIPSDLSGDAQKEKGLEAKVVNVGVEESKGQDPTENVLQTCDVQKAEAVIEKHCNRIEEIVPVMEVSETVKEDKTSLRRTFSATEPKIERKHSRTFGSHETIPTASNKTDKMRRSIAVSRRASIEKAASTPTRRPTAKKVETGVGTEAKSPKVEIPKRPIKQRSEIVAAVTQRLYNKVKRKEVATETDEIKPEEVPKELTICSNARLRLQEITRRALKAHKFKDGETQTDLFPVLRVKEVSTDADDLRAVLMEVKDAQTEPRTEMKDVGISCSLALVEGKAFVLTRSCATQAVEEERDCQKQNALFSSPISFTRYLQQQHPEPKCQMLTTCSGNPIYTSSVNINVSHNYDSTTKPPTNSSEDSLEQNLCFPTPDLISNHNSLDAHVNTDEFKASDANRLDERVNYAQTTVMDNPYLTHQNMEPSCPNVCIASCKLIPQCNENVKSIDIPAARAPEVCVVKNFPEDRCTPLRNTYPKLETPSVIESTVEKKFEPIRLQKATVLKSIMKQDDVDSETESESPSSVYNKKVRFSKKASDTCRMFKAMSNFLEEATSLIGNLSAIASKMDSKQDQPQAYDIEVTVNDVSNITDPPSSVKNQAIQTETKNQRSTPSQTSPKRTTNTSSHTDDFEFPINKYELLVQDSCNRLERCINAAMRNEEQPASGSEDQDFLHRFPQPFYVASPWMPYRAEDSSMESTPTFSDYGSLPRTSRRSRVAGCSPSALLRHLTSMRQDIVRTSREELFSPSAGETL